MKSTATSRRLLAAILVAGAALASFAEPVNVKGPPGPSAELTQAVALLSQGKLKEADALFQKALSRQPDQLDAALGRAQIAVTQHDLGQADQMVAAVLKKNDSLPEAHNMEGVLLLLHKDDAGARREFSRAIQLKPAYVTPHLYLAVMARVSGNYAQAAAEYKQLAVVAPRLPAGYLGQAEALTMQHREADAIGILNSWKSADPATLLPYQVIANIHISDRKPQEAIRECQAALAKSPNDSATMAILGDAYAAAGNSATAANEYQTALSIDQSNIDAAMHLALLEISQQETEKATYHLRMVLRIQPDNAVACNDLAWLMVTQGNNLDEALRLAQTAVKSEPRYADAYDTLGWVQYNRGQYAPAIATLRQAQALNPASADVAAHLGLAYAKLGRGQDALPQLKRALQSPGLTADRSQLQRAVTQLSSH